MPTVDTPPQPASATLAAEDFELFTFAVLALHDVLPTAGGQPARCRTCHVPPERCDIWALSTGLLGITPPDGPVCDR